MIEKIRVAANRFAQIEQRLSLPETAADRDAYLALIRERTRLEPLAAAFAEYEAREREMREADDLLASETDPELRSLAGEERRMAKAAMAAAEDRMQQLLIPRDPDADRNVMMELRACAGGEEAALFAAVLYRMYGMYADKKHFRTEVISANETELGGFRELTVRFSGEGVYDRLRFESGVHRVQRIPVTESNGKIQTSTVTVAMLPEAENVDVTVDPADLTIETIKSSGAGGQHINKTESAVRVIHRPSGIVIEARNERSQLQNKEQALRLLRTKLYERKQAESQQRISDQRRAQIGSGDRSEKIRTYNYPQNRVTDHRINKTIYSLDSFLNGDLDSMIDALAAADATEKLKGEQA